MKTILKMINAVDKVQTVTQEEKLIKDECVRHLIEQAKKTQDAASFEIIYKAGKGFVLVKIKQPKQPIKKFFWKDKSGRGMTNTFTLSNLLNAFPSPPVEDEDEARENVSYDGETVEDWAECAEVGDTWENAANEITRTK